MVFSSMILQQKGFLSLTACLLVGQTLLITVVLRIDMLILLKLWSYFSQRLSAIEKNLKSVCKWKIILRRVILLQVNYSHLIKTGKVSNSDLPDEFTNLPTCISEEVFYRIIYDGYLQREIKAVHRIQSASEMKIPSDFTYSNLPGLRKESVDKLSEVKPSTLGQASRISGVNPADITILHIYLERNRINS